MVLADEYGKLASELASVRVDVPVVVQDGEQKARSALHRAQRISRSARVVTESSIINPKPANPIFSINKLRSQRD